MRSGRVEPCKRPCKEAAHRVVRPPSALGLEGEETDRVPLSAFIHSEERLLGQHTPEEYEVVVDVLVAQRLVFIEQAGSGELLAQPRADDRIRAREERNRLLKKRRR